MDGNVLSMMLAAVGELLFGTLYLAYYAVTGVLYVVVKVVEAILLELIPLVTQIVRWGLILLSNFILCLTRFIYYILALSSEFIVQLDWQYGYDILAETVYTIYTGIVTCGSNILTFTWVIVSYVVLLLASMCVLIWTAISFILLHVWNFIINLGSTMVAIISGRGENLNLGVISSAVSTETIMHGLKVGAFAVVLTFCSYMIIRCVWEMIKFVSWCFKDGTVSSTRVTTRESSRLPARVDSRLNELRTMNDQDEQDGKVLETPINSTRRRIKTDSSPDKESRSHMLKQELEEARKLLAKHEEEKLCAVCYDSPRAVVVHPCNHYCLCVKCRRELQICPICNTYIQSSEKIFNV